MLTAVKLWLLLTGLDVCGQTDSDMVEVVVAFTLPEAPVSLLLRRDKSRLNGRSRLTRKLFCLFFFLRDFQKPKVQTKQDVVAGLKN